MDNITEIKENSGKIILVSRSEIYVLLVKIHMFRYILDVKLVVLARKLYVFWVENLRILGQKSTYSTYFGCGRSSRHPDTSIIQL